MSSWKVIAAAVRGPDHEADRLPCQDAYSHAEAGDRLVAVVSDGAGSARFSETGAKVLCHEVVAALSTCDKALDGGHEPWRPAVEQAVERARAALEARIPEEIALGAPVTLADYHATLVGVVAAPNGGFFFHIGDGTAAAVSEIGDWAGCRLSLPENGEFANETYFFTQEIWRDHLRFTDFGASPLIVMVSDGAMPFTVAERFAGLEGRFMAPVTRYLEGASPEDGAKALAGTLDRADARRISGDDKTLLWARLIDPQ
ncbi:MAG: PP2C family serine/threonine-protein phosphatase [Pseudomonadota bacterium]